MPRKVNDAEVKREIVALHKAGRSYRQIAKELGVSQPYISKALKEAAEAPPAAASSAAAETPAAGEDFALQEPPAPAPKKKAAPPPAGDPPERVDGAPKPSGGRTLVF